MATTDFSLPVPGVTGTAFRNNLLGILQALASNSSADTEPPVTYPGMLQVFTVGGVPQLRIRNSANTAWVVLLPDVSIPLGGLSEALEDDVTLDGDNTFTGTNTFVEPPVMPGYTSDSELDTAISGLNASIATRTTPSQVNSLIASALGGAQPIFTKGYENSFSPSFNSLNSFNHNLGEIPKIVSVEIVIENSVFGYSPSHVLEVPQFNLTTGSGGITTRKDSGVVEVMVGSQIFIHRRDTRAPVALTDGSDFNLRVRAYA